MIIEPMIRSNMCINAHPKGCAADVKHQIEFIEKKFTTRNIPADAPKTVLVLGCSTGYGLASRIVAAFGYKAITIGVSFEKEGSDGGIGESREKTGTPGWYNNMAFDKFAKEAGLESVTFNGDAFSHEMRQNVINTLKKMGKKVDLLVYSVASSVRVDPDNGTIYRSVLKPIGKVFTGATIDCLSGKISTISAEPATAEEAANTVKVMGGEDWALWVRKLKEAGVLAEGVKTVAYSYIGPKLSHAIYRDGPKLSHAIYRDGTIGGAKKHLEATALELNSELQNDLHGEAYVSVNKGLVTRSSAVIPIIPMYISVLFKVMKEMGNHEGCIEQMDRLMTERLYTGSKVPQTRITSSASTTTNWTRKSRQKWISVWQQSRKKTSPKWATSKDTATTSSRQTVSTSKA